MITLDEVNTGNGIVIGMDMIFINTRNKNLKTGYDINKKVIWSAYLHHEFVFYNYTCIINLVYME
jgi:hypothetical protein